MSTEYRKNGWSATEEQKLVDCMKEGVKNNKNILEIFAEASKLIGRTESAVMQRWYAIREKHVEKLL